MIIDRHAQYAIPTNGTRATRRHRTSVHKIMMINQITIFTNETYIRLIANVIQKQSSRIFTDSRQGFTITGSRSNMSRFLIRTIIRTIPVHDICISKAIQTTDLKWTSSNRWNIIITYDIQIDIRFPFPIMSLWNDQSSTSEKHIKKERRGKTFIYEWKRKLYHRHIWNWRDA